MDDDVHLHTTPIDEAEHMKFLEGMLKANHILIMMNTDSSLRAARLHRHLADSITRHYQTLIKYLLFIDLVKCNKKKESAWRVFRKCCAKWIHCR